MSEQAREKVLNLIKELGETQSDLMHANGNFDKLQKENESLEKSRDELLDALVRYSDYQMFKGDVRRVIIKAKKLKEQETK